MHKLRGACTRPPRGPYAKIQELKSMQTQQVWQTCANRTFAQAWTRHGACGHEGLGQKAPDVTDRIRAVNTFTQICVTVHTWRAASAPPNLQRCPCARHPLCVLPCSCPPILGRSIGHRVRPVPHRPRGKCPLRHDQATCERKAKKDAPAAVTSRAACVSRAPPADANRPALLGWGRPA